MIYKIGNQKIIISESETKTDKGTPYQVVGWRDVAETCKTLHAISSQIPIKAPNIVDGIARSGFWGAIFRDIWPDCKLQLNEAEVRCSDVLKRNFPNDKITHNDIKLWHPKSCDISLLDFDHFTLRILDQWKEVLIEWAKVSKYFIIADGACFGFKFGNMKHYEITDEKQYYYLLNEALIKFLDKRITVVSRFTNASTILLEDKTISNKKKEIKFVDPDGSLFLSKGEKVFSYDVNKMPKSLF